MTILPTYVPELIRLAIDDLRKTMADPAYVINMRYWHEPIPGTGTCSVCLAGSVIAQRLGVSIDVDFEPWDDMDNRPQLSALNWLRLGSCGLAATELAQELPYGLPFAVCMPYYDHNNPEVFIAAMLALADRWEQALQ